MDTRDLDSILRSIPKSKKRALDFKDFMKPMNSFKAGKARPVQASANKKLTMAPKMPKAPKMPTLRPRSI